MNLLIEEILIAIFLQCLGLDIPNISNFGKNEASFTYLTVTILSHQGAQRKENPYPNKFISIFPSGNFSRS